MISPKLARHIGTNSACISRHYNYAADAVPTLGAYEEIGIAAEHLGRIEVARPAFWETVANDWESVCVRIAVYIERHGVAPVTDEILGYCRNPRG